MAKYRDALAFALIITTFLGEIWIGITIPISMIVASALFVTSPMKLSNFTLSLFLLSGLALVLVSQWLLGAPPNGKSDLVVYLPFAYAGFTLLAMRNVTVPDKALSTAIRIGGALTGVLMLVIAVFVPADAPLLPGQNFWLTDQQYAGSQNVGNSLSPIAAEPLDVPQIFGDDISNDEYLFYEFKNRFKTTLGLSNYLAVFFVFSFTVAAFTNRNLWAVFFAILTGATLSRFGIGFLVLSALCAGLYRLRAPILWIAVAAFAASAAMTAVLWFAQDLSFFPTSLKARVDLWRTGFDAIALNPWLGSSRSHVIGGLNLSLTWNPHNLFLLIWTYFGVVGVALYIAYVSVGLKAFFHLAKASSLWSGILVGAVVLLGWAAFEPIVMTPAFEILFAAICAIAIARRDEGKLVA